MLCVVHLELYCTVLSCTVLYCCTVEAFETSNALGCPIISRPSSLGVWRQRMPLITHTVRCDDSWRCVHLSSMIIFNLSFPMLLIGEVLERTHFEESVDLVRQLQNLEGVERQADIRQHDPSSVHLPHFFARRREQSARRENPVGA